MRSPNDDYKDDFEAYDNDEFEVELEVELQASKTQAPRAVAGAAKKKGSGPLQDLQAIHDMVKHENSDMAARVARTDGTQPTLEKECPGHRPKTLTAKRQRYTASVTGRSLEWFSPFVRRAQAVRNRLKLGFERYIAFDQLPLTNYQIYLCQFQSIEPPSHEYVARSPIANR